MNFVFKSLGRDQDGIQVQAGDVIRAIHFPLVKIAALFAGIGVQQAMHHRSQLFQNTQQVFCMDAGTVNSNASIIQGPLGNTFQQSGAKNIGQDLHFLFVSVQSHQKLFFFRGRVQSPAVRLFRWILPQPR